MVRKLQPWHSAVAEVFVDAVLLRVTATHCALVKYMFTCTCSLLQYRLCIKLMLAIELVQNLQNVTLRYVQKSIIIF